MSISYTSIFDAPTIITKKDLCIILNLDISRPGLIFSNTEIRTAYKKRAMFVHPDCQQRKKPPMLPIPTDICNTLTNDITLARDYMLKGEDNILGKALLERRQGLFAVADEFVNEIIGFLNKIESKGAEISKIVTWLSRFSNNFFMILLLSTFSDNQSNFRYVTIFSKELDVIRPYLKDIDGTFLIKFLFQIKEALDSNNQEEITIILTELKESLPQNLIENKKFDELLVAIQGANKSLKEILTTDLIEHLQHIIQFWPTFIATVPSSRHIIGVYFISLLFTASSLYRYFSATKTIIDVIWQQKGTTTLILMILPMLLLTLALLPLNIAIQLGIKLTWIALKVFFQIVVNSALSLYAAVNIVCSLFNNHISLSHHVFSLLECVFYLTIRLAFNIVIQVADKITFILTNQSIFSSFQDTVNDWLDLITSRLRPTKVAEKLPLITISQDKIEEPLRHEEFNQPFGFFNNTKANIHNIEDRWLDKLLADISTQYQSEVPDNPVMNPAM